ncbi:MAG: response regulator [Sulfuricellaceae bacterium]
MAHILLIDDDEQFRFMLAQMLTQDAHRVTVAGDGEEGLLLSRQFKPELILIDILMPHKDGIETIMELIRDGSKIPIIAMSGGRRFISAEFNLESASMIGVKTILTKPFTRADLRQAIAEALAGE